MFQWYSKAQVCYVYLEDFQEWQSNSGAAVGQSFLNSRWWTRAWTLQELLAPRNVIFYDRSWTRLGTKTETAHIISKKTGIDETSLYDPRVLYDRSVAQRMSWASERHATRAEDLAYSLLGIFQIHMSMQYGEGPSAFIRLQKEIMKSTNDQSLFAWGFKPQLFDNLVLQRRAGHHVYNIYEKPFQMSEHGVLAKSPAAFINCRDIVFHFRYADDSHMGEENGATRLEIPLIAVSNSRLPKGVTDLGYGYDFGLIPCGLGSRPHYLLGFLLLRWRGSNRFVRVRPDTDTYTFLIHIKEAAKLRRETVWIDDLVRLRRDKNMHDVFDGLRWSIILEMPQVQVSSRIDFTGVVPFDKMDKSVIEQWSWNDAESTLELQGPCVNKFVIISFSSLHSSEIFYIVVRLTWNPDIQTHIFIVNREEGWEEKVVRVLSDEDFGQQEKGRHWGVDVMAETKQVFNHVLSTIYMREVRPNFVETQRSSRNVEAMGRML